MTYRKSPLSSLPGWDIAERIAAEQHNAEVLSNLRAKEQWSDTFIDPDAEQLAGDVVREMARVG